MTAYVQQNILSACVMHMSFVRLIREMRNTLIQESFAHVMNDTSKDRPRANFALIVYLQKIAKMTQLRHVPKPNTLLVVS